MMTYGVTSGARSSARTAPAAGSRPRAIPKAAPVPRSTESTVASRPTRVLTRSESIQRASPKNCSYHRSDSPGGGNWKCGAELRDIGTMTRFGKIRYRSTSDPIASSAGDVRVSIAAPSPVDLEGAEAVELEDARAGGEGAQRDAEEHERQRRRLPPRQPLRDALLDHHRHHDVG